MTTIRGSKKSLTHELLLSAARDLFESRGYAHTTVDDIAVAAGTTRATLYLHFSSKAELLESLVTRVAEFFADSPLRDVVAGGEPAEIRGWLDRTLDQWVRIRPYLALIAQADADPVISAAVDRGHDLSIARMCAGLDDADRFDADSRVIRCTIAFGALESLSRRYVRGGGWRGLGRRRSLDALAVAWCRLLTEPRG